MCVDGVGGLEMLEQRSSIVVQTGGITSTIVVEAEGLAGLGTLVAAHGFGRGRVFVVSDDGVWGAHGERALAALAAAGLDPRWTTVPAGEESKSLARAIELYTWLAGERAERALVARIPDWAVLAAGHGKRTLLCEVDAKGDLSQVLETDPLRYQRREVLPNLFAMVMDTEASLREYLQLQLHMPSWTRLGPLARRLFFPQELEALLHYNL